jgi:hypothetical protein
MNEMNTPREPQQSAGLAFCSRRFSAGLAKLFDERKQGRTVLAASRGLFQFADCPMQVAALAFKRTYFSL